VPTHGGSKTLPALLGAYLEDLHVRRYAAASGVRARHVLPRLFSHLRRQGVRDPRRVTESHLVSFARALKEPGANGRPLAAWSRSAYLAAVRSFFAFLEKHGLLLRNPALELHLPKARRLPRARLSEGQVRRLLAAPFPGSPIGLRDRAILEVLYGTGIRVSECARLDVGDVDLYEGTLLAAEEALRIGLVDFVVPPERLRAQTQAYAADLARKPAEALAAIRRCITQGIEAPFDEGLEIELEEAVRLAGTADFREGLEAFLDKRPPRWR